MDEIDQYIEQNHREAFNIVHIFFSFSDLFLIGIILFITKFNIKYIKQLLFLIGIDIVIRIIKIFTYYTKNSYSKEIFLTTLTCCQFFLIISFFNNAMSNLESGSSQNEIGSLENTIFTTLFFFIIFPFEKLYYSESKAFYFFKCLALFLCLYSFYRILKNKYKDYIENLKGKLQNVILLSIFANMPKLAFYCFNGKIFLYLIEKFFKNKLLLSYLDMAQIALNETAKYSIFLILSSLLYIWSFDFIEYNKDNESYSVTVNQAID